MNDQKRCPCGGIILADTEEWQSKKQILIDVKLFTAEDRICIFIPPRVWGHKMLSKWVKKAIDITFSDQ